MLQGLLKGFKTSEQTLVGKLREISPDLSRSLVVLFAYWVWIVVFRLVCTSFLVYFLTRSGKSVGFEEINESFGSNELVFMGIGAVLFFILLKGFSPLFDQQSSLGMSWKNLKNDYLPGLLRGVLLALSILLGFVLTGTYKYIGFFVQIEDTPLAISGILFRVLALLALGLTEEFLFRNSRYAGYFTLLGLSLFFCLIKLNQFELGWMQGLTLFLASCYLAVRRIQENSFLDGAGFWAGLLIIFHPVFSLPIFGNDFSGIFLLKYQPQKLIPASISGGIGGPLSGLALQAILLIEILRSWLPLKKSLLKG